MWSRAVALLGGTRARLLTSLAVVAGIIVGSGTVIGGSVLATDPTTVFLEAASSVGPLPFRSAATVVKLVRPLNRTTRSTSVKAPAPLDGGERGLYGGSLNNALCETEQLVEFLAGDRAKAKAWASVFGIGPDGIADYVKTLTPVLLQVDIRVTNHGYQNGKATPRQSILQAGTAVLVDREGVPRVRCMCGNPLLAPQPIKGKIRLEGSQWESFETQRIYEIKPGSPEGGFWLLDVDTGEEFFRPFATRGEQDQRNQAIPDVVGQPIAQAEESLRAAGFIVVKVARDSSQPAGLVIETTPAPGTRAAKSSTVTLAVSSGSPPAKPVAVTVPELAGADPVVAKAILEGLSLVAGNPEPEPSDRIPTGQVTRTDPAPNTSVKPASIVKLFVSTGPAVAKVIVPDVTNLTFVSAQQRLEAMGLRLSVTRRPNATVPKDIVINTDPGPGAEISAGSSVSVVVSSGPASRPVPDVVGRTQPEATAALQEAELGFQTASEASPEAPAGTVFRQSPPAGTDVSPGTVVTIVVSTGKPTTAVPALGGKSQVDAEKLVAGLGLGLNVVPQPSATVAKGIVVSQTPGAGVGVIVGSVVTIVVSQGPAPIPVCRAVSLVLSQARADCGEFVLVSTERSDESVPAGTVISQSPLPGVLALPGTQVAVVVSLGPKPRTVPSVVGLAVAGARALLDQEFLRLSASEEFSDTVEAGLAIRQSPPAQAVVARDTTVAVVFSRGRAPTVVPDLANRTVAAAQALLISARLVLGATSESFHGTIPTGAIVSQSVVAGSTVAPGTAVNVVVSAGPDLRCVDVVGLTQAGASAKLATGGLSGTVTLQDSTTVAIGKVVSQSAACAPVGGSIEIAVSRGTLVPDVLGRTSPAASLVLQGAGLVAAIVNECTYAEGLANGIVYDQSPTGGRVEPGTSVYIYVQLCSGGY